LKDKIERLVSGKVKSQEWYEDIVKDFPDDMEDLPPASRPTALADKDKAQLLSKARGTARTAKTSAETARKNKKQRELGMLDDGDENGGGDEGDDMELNPDVLSMDDPGDDLDDEEEEEEGGEEDEEE
jgi:hypothetical protein